MFSSKTITNVASVVYNLIGDVAKRPQFRKTLVLRNLMSGTSTIAMDTVFAYLKGPAMDLRSYMRWAKNNYASVGIPSGSLAVSQSPSIPGLIIEANSDSGGVGLPWIQMTDYSNYDPALWLDKYIMENNPFWQNHIEVLRRKPSGELEVGYRATPSAYALTYFTLPYGFISTTAKYIWAIYKTFATQQWEPMRAEDMYDSGPLGSNPYPTPAPGSVLQGVLSGPHTLSWNDTTTVRRTWSDGRTPTETVTNTPRTYSGSRTTQLYTLETVNGYNPVRKSPQYMRKTQRNIEGRRVVFTETSNTNTINVGGGVTRTTVTTTRTGTATYSNWTEIDTEYGTGGSPSGNRMVIYRIGTGNTLLDTGPVINYNMDKFFPVIPVRLNNQFLDPAIHGASLVNLSRKAFKRLTRQNIDKLIAQIEDNDDLADIDYAYIVNGIPINVVEQKGMAYLYAFFKKLMLLQAGGATAYDVAVGNFTTFQNQVTAYQAWYDAYWNASEGRPHVGAPIRPSVIADVVESSKIMKNRLEIKSPAASANDSYEVVLEWSYVAETTHSGKFTSSAKVGEYRIIGGGINPTVLTMSTQTIRKGGSGGEDEDVQYPEKAQQIYIDYQETATTYKRLRVVGAIHSNFVYDGEAVIIEALDALDETDESGFLIPLHEQTFREMRLTHATQLATAASYIVFNCYVQKKQKWYQSGIFRVLIAVAVIVAPQLLGFTAGIGLLGSNLAIGTSMGLAGSSAFIAGAVVNALAAVMLQMVLSPFTSRIFGDTLGPIMASLITMGISSMATGQSFAQGFSLKWGDMMRADRLLELVQTGLDAYAKWVNGQVNDMQNSMQTFLDNANNQLETIEQMYRDLTSSSIATDPWMFTQAAYPQVEGLDAFLQRTLLTGMDIATVSQNMITNFSDMTLNLPTAYQ